jgi:fumarylacetoacetase
VPYVRPEGAPPPLPYLSSASNRDSGAIDIKLEALLQSAAMRARLEPPQRLSTTTFRHAYWTAAQLIAHHTVNGCNLRAGDLLGTGTQSGPSPEEAGSLLELSAGGTRLIRLSAGETRTFLEDGDTVVCAAGASAPTRRESVSAAHKEPCSQRLIRTPQREARSQFAWQSRSHSQAPD